MSSGRTIRYLIDGVPTGALLAKIINRTGRVLVFLWQQLSDIAKRDEIRRTGIYCLVGVDPESSLHERVYVVEGDSVLTPRRHVILWSRAALKATCRVTACSVLCYIISQAGRGGRERRRESCC